MIVVTAASGRLGQRVVAELLKCVETKQIGISARDPEKMKAFAELGIRVRRGDYDDIDTMSSSLDGADTVLFVSSHGTNDQRLRQHKTVVDAADRCNVGRLVYTSFMEPVPENPFPFADVHRITEHYIRHSGLDFTFLRDNFYADNVLEELPAIQAAGALRWPSDEGRCAYVARDDVAAAAAAVLTGEGHEAKTYTLTGPEALTNAEVAAVLSDVLGRDIPLQVIGRDAYKREIMETGAPDWAADGALASFDSMAQGFCEEIFPDCENLIGRRSLTMRDVLEKYVA